MTRLLGLAAVAGMLMSAAAVSMPASAAEVPAHCAVFPLLKAECREAIRAAAEDASVTVVATSSSAAATSADVVSDAVDSVTGWKCVRTPGGKALFSCSK